VKSVNLPLLILWMIFCVFFEISFMASLFFLAKPKPTTLLITLLIFAPIIDGFDDNSLTKVLAHDDSHYQVFDRVGQMASSTSYIHVMLPLNFSTIREHAKILIQQLAKLKDTKTPHLGHKLEIAKQSSDIAHRLYFRVEKVLSRVETLNKLLPLGHDRPRHERDLRDYDESTDQNLILEKFNSHFRTKRQLSHGLVRQQMNSNYFRKRSTTENPSHRLIADLNKYKIRNAELRIKVRKNVELALKSLPSEYLNIWDHTQFELPSVSCRGTTKIESHIDCYNKENVLLDGLNEEIESQLEFITNPAVSVLSPKRNSRHVNSRTALSDFLEFFLSIDKNLTISHPLPRHDLDDEFLPLDHEHLAPLRRKRSIFLIATKVVGTFMGLYNSMELKSISNRLHLVEQNQDLMIHLANKHSKQIRHLSATLAELSDTFQAYVKANPTLLYAELNDHIMHLEERVTRLVNMIQQLQNRRLSVDWLDEEQMKLLHQSVLDRSVQLKHTLLVEQYSDYFQLELSYLREDDDVTAILHVPTILTHEMLSIYRYLSFPIPLDIPISKTSMSIGDALALTHLDSDSLPAFQMQPPHNNRTDALFLIPDADMIAIDGDKNFRLLDNADLTGCIQRNHVFLCEQQQILQTDLTTTCLGSLYSRDLAGVQRSCKFEQRPLVEKVFQLSTNDFLVYSPTVYSQTVKCLNGDNHPADFGHSTKLHLPNGCSIQLNKHILRVDEKFHQPLRPHISEWKWQPLQLPVSLLSENSHLEANLLLLNKHLTNLSSANYNNTVYLHLLNTHLNHLTNNHLNQTENFHTHLTDLSQSLGSLPPPAALLTAEDVPDLIEKVKPSGLNFSGMAIFLWTIFALLLLLSGFVASNYLWRKYRRSLRLASLMAKAVGHLRGPVQDLAAHAAHAINPAVGANLYPNLPAYPSV
jgi:hypothetical protein